MAAEIKKTEPKPLTRYEKLEQDFNSERFQTAITNALPESGVDTKKFLRVALTILNKNPKIALCTRPSIAQCLLDCASMGIEPDGRRAHLIPYENSVKQNNGQWLKIMTCTLQLDYKGIVELVRRSGVVSNISCNVVYEKDEFDFAEGTKSFLKHKRALKDRGEMLCFYSFVTFKDGSSSFEIMSIDEVNKIRDASQGYMAAKRAAESYKKELNHPWKQYYEAMGRKTVFKRHSKWLTLSPEIHEAIQIDNVNENLTHEQRIEIAKPALPADGEDLFADVGKTLEGASRPAEDANIEIVDEGGKGTAAPAEKEMSKKDKRALVTNVSKAYKANGVKAEQLVVYLKKNKHGNHDALIDFPEEKLFILMEHQDKIVEDILSPKQEESK